MTYPTLSVLIPVYNGAKYIRRCLNSVLSQSVLPQEIIVLNDASTDDTVEIIKEYQSNHSLIKLLHNEKNKGLILSQNRLINEASSEYLFFLACDDWVEKDFLKESLDILKAHPEAGLCCTDPAFYFVKDNRLVKGRYCWAESACYICPDELRLLLRGGYYIETHTMITKKSSVLKAGCYIDKLSWHADWFLAHVIALREGICYIPLALATREIRDDAWSAGCGDFNKRANILADIIRLLKTDYRDCLPAFVDSMIMHTFGTHTAEVVLKDSEFWDVESLLLTALPMFKKLSEINTLQGQRFKLSAFKNQVDELNELYFKGGYRELNNALQGIVKNQTLELNLIIMIINMLVQNKLFFTARDFLSDCMQTQSYRPLKDLLSQLTESCKAITKRCLIAEELIKDSRYERAIDELLVNIQHCTDHVDTLNALSVAYYKSGNSQEAFKYITIALDIAPENDDVKENFRIIKQLV